MINIHLYPSPFLNESRILREACSLSRLALFDRIDLVGVGQEGLPAMEDLHGNIRIVRRPARQAEAHHQLEPRGLPALP